MAKLLGARNSPQLLRSEAHFQRCLPSKHFRAMRWHETVSLTLRREIDLKKKSVKEKRDFLAAVLVEDRLYFVAIDSTLTGPHAPMCVRLRDIFRPVVRGDHASYLADDEMVARSQHVQLPWRVPAAFPDIPGGYDFFVVEEDSLLVPHLNAAWLGQITRETLGAKAQIALAPAEEMRSFVTDVIHDFERATRDTQRAKLLLELCETAQNDREVMRCVLDGVGRRSFITSLFEDLQDAAAEAPDSKASLALSNLEYVQAILMLLQCCLFNSETVKERYKLFDPRPLTFTELVTAIFLFGNRHKLWRDEESDEESGGGGGGGGDGAGAGARRASVLDLTPSDARRRLPPYYHRMTPEQLQVHDEIRDVQVALLGELDTLLEFAYLEDKGPPRVSDVASLVDSVGCIPDPFSVFVAIRLQSMVKGLAECRRAKTGAASHSEFRRAVRRSRHLGERAGAGAGSGGGDKALRASSPGSLHAHSATAAGGSSHKLSTGPAVSRSVEGSLRRSASSRSADGVTPPVASAAAERQAAFAARGASKSLLGNLGASVKQVLFRGSAAREALVDADDDVDLDAGDRGEARGRGAHHGGRRADGDRTSPAGSSDGGRPRSVRFSDDEGSDREGGGGDGDDAAGGRGRSAFSRTRADDNGRGERPPRRPARGDRDRERDRDGGDGDGGGDRRRPPRHPRASPDSLVSDDEGGAAAHGAGAAETRVGGRGHPSRRGSHAVALALFNDPTYDSPSFRLNFARYCRALYLLLQHDDTRRIIHDLVYGEYLTFVMPIVDDMSLYVDVSVPLNQDAVLHLQRAMATLKAAGEEL